MSGSSYNFPTDQIAQEIFSRLCENNPVASAELCEHFLPPLINWLQARNPYAHENQCAQAAADALLNLIRNPSQYDPAKISLAKYLCMSAQGDLKNLLRREQKHSHQSLQSVELSDTRGKYIGRVDDPSLPAQIAEEKQKRLDSLPKGLLDGWTETDRQVFALIMENERRTEVCAKALSLDHLSKEEQAKIVKQHKDRINKRLERIGFFDDRSP